MFTALHNTTNASRARAYYYLAPLLLGLGAAGHVHHRVVLLPGQPGRVVRARRPGPLVVAGRPAAPAPVLGAVVRLVLVLAPLAARAAVVGVGGAGGVVVAGVAAVVGVRAARGGGGTAGGRLWWWAGWER